MKSKRSRKDKALRKSIAKIKAVRLERLKEWAEWWRNKLKYETTSNI